MRLLQIIFSVIWVLGYLGNGFLFIHTEWIILQKNFIQILNPFFHFQVLVTLLSNPLFWIFLSMAVIGYYVAMKIEKNLLKNVKQSQVITKETTSLTDVLPQTHRHFKDEMQRGLMKQRILRKGCDSQEIFSVCDL